MTIATAAGAQERKAAWREEATPAAYAALAEEIEAALLDDVIRAWFPRAVDEGGGFHATFSRDWKRGDDEVTSTVFQARMTWMASQIAMARPELREELLPPVRSGVAVLESRLWDAKHGGFFWAVDDSGTPEPPDTKHVYAQAFGIFAAASAHAATGDARSLELARRAFDWIDRHAHDAKNLGYFEMLGRDGTPLPAPEQITAETPRYRTFVAGFKTSDAHLHLLEAMTQLYRVWKDPRVRVRLEELLVVVRDRLATEPGCLHPATWPDWRPVPMENSFGHDVEAAFLILDAAEALGMARHPASLRTARRLTDHAMALAFDHQRGGLAERGSAIHVSRGRELQWWAQVEALNTLSLMHSLHAGETDVYWRALLLQWRFLRARFVDSVHRGLFESVSLDGRRGRPAKGNHWKDAYHEGRAFLLTAQRLRALAGARQANHTLR